MAKKPLKVTEQVDYLLGKLQPGLRTKKKAALAEFGVSFLKRLEWCSREDATRLFVGDKKYPIGLLAICGKTKSSGAFQRAAHPAVDLVFNLQEPSKNSLDWFIFRQVFLKLDAEQIGAMALPMHEPRPSVVALRQFLNTPQELLEEAERAERVALPAGVAPATETVAISEPVRRSTFSFSILRPPRHARDEDRSADDLKTPSKPRSSIFGSADALSAAPTPSPRGRSPSRSATLPAPLRVTEVKSTSALPALLDGITKEDVQASVQALAGLEAPIETVYDQHRVRAYRVSKEDCTKEFQEGLANWNTPEFFSDRSVPESFVLQCVIHIDADFGFSMRVTEQSLVSSLLEKAVGKAKVKSIEYPRPALKVKGCCSYLDAGKLCISYQSAREAARAGRNLELVFVNTPEALSHTPPSPWRLAWGGMVISEPVSASKLLSQQNIPLKVKELVAVGLRDTNALVFAHVMITFGSTVLTTSTSALLPSQKRLRFNLVAPDPPITYQQLPREARLGVAFHADDKGKRLLLGWSVTQMFDEKGMLRQGTIVLNLRDPPETHSELCQLFARASTAEGKCEGSTTSLQLEEFVNPVFHDDAVTAATVLPAAPTRGRGDSSAIRNSVTPSRVTLSPDDSKSNVLPMTPSAVCRCPPSEDKNKFCMKCGKRRPGVTKEEVSMKSNEIQCTCGKVVERSKVYCFGCGCQVSKLLATEARRLQPAGATTLATPSASTTLATPSASTPMVVVSLAAVNTPAAALKPEPAPVSAFTFGVKQTTEPDGLWATRQTLTDKPHMLVPVLQSCNWANPAQRAEARRMLASWARPLLVHALQLLDVTFADGAVRELAVQSLSSLPACRLQLYLLQLTQCLKFESYHRSALSVFLVKSALKYPLVIGHPLYFHIRTEMQMHPMFAERYSLLLVDFLSYGGPLLRELRTQVEALGQLQRVAEMVVARKEAGKLSKEDIMQEYTQELVKLNCFFFSRLDRMKLPLNPQVEVTSLLVDKCRFMSSKKVPLWLPFQSADPGELEPVYVIFKSGDDLRQDMLTLQLLSIMDDFWLQDGHDLRLTPYRVLATGVNSRGEGMGMIEVVTNSDTTSGIQGSFGGGAMGAFKLTPLHDYLTAANAGEAFKTAVNMFMKSSAGYCVATYVMGIGDRHNGNIMVKRDGHLFHIDFGHFLGNFKSKFGVRRERAPFVFTPEMAFVIGGKNFEQAPQYKVFEELCVKAFNSLRSREALLYTLFGLMVSAGMPELLSEDDITYMREQLCLGATDQEAAEVFLKELGASVSATSRRVDNFFHIAKHG